MLLSTVGRCLQTRLNGSVLDIGFCIMPSISLQFIITFLSSGWRWSARRELPHKTFRSCKCRSKHALRSNPTTAAQRCAERSLRMVSGTGVLGGPLRPCGGAVGAARVRRARARAAPADAVERPVECPRSKSESQSVCTSGTACPIRYAYSEYVYM